MIGSIILRTAPDPYTQITIYNNDGFIYNYFDIFTPTEHISLVSVINFLLPFLFDLLQLP